MDCIVLNRKGLGSMMPSDNPDNFEKNKNKNMKQKQKQKHEKLEYKQ